MFDRLIDHYILIFMSSMILKDLTGGLSQKKNADYGCCWTIRSDKCFKLKIKMKNSKSNKTEISRSSEWIFTWVMWYKKPLCICMNCTVFNSKSECFFFHLIKVTIFNLMIYHVYLHVTSYTLHEWCNLWNMDFYLFVACVNRSHCGWFFVGSFFTCFLLIFTKFTHMFAYYMIISKCNVHHFLISISRLLVHSFDLLINLPSSHLNWIWKFEKKSKKNTKKRTLTLNNLSFWYQTSSSSSGTYCCSVFKSSRERDKIFRRDTISCKYIKKTEEKEEKENKISDAKRDTNWKLIKNKENSPHI